MSVHQISVTTRMKVVVSDPSVFNRATGDYGEYWRGIDPSLAEVRTKEDVLSFLVVQAVEHGVTDISLIPGFEDCDSKSVVFHSPEEGVSIHVGPV